MNREDILKMAQDENKGRDVAGLDAVYKSAYAAYIVGILLIVLVDTVEGLLWHKISYGANMAVFAMACTAFITKYRILKKRHELVVAILYGGGAAIWLVLWILQLCGVTD